MRFLLAIALTACVVHETRIVVVRSLCESRFEQPAIRCESGVLSFDGCRWACRLEPTEQEPMRLTLNLGADIEAVQRMELCVTPTCEGK